MSWQTETLIKTRKADRNCLFCKETCCVACFEDQGGSLFKSLSKSELELLVENKQQVTFKAGETILKQNTVSSHIVCLRRGITKVYVESGKGKSLILRLIKDSGMITSGGIFSQNVRQFTVSAVTEVECCFINSEKILHLFSSNGDFAIALLNQHNFQNSQMFNTLINLTQKYMPGRVADSLLYLKNEIFQTNPFPLPLSRQELADMSAMTKESYVRILKEFKTSGLVRFDGKSAEILDEETLVSISKNG